MDDTLFTKNAPVVKNELEIEEEYVDDKILAHKTAVNINDIELKDCLRNDKIEEYEVSTADVYVMKELSSTETCNTVINGIVKVKDEISVVNDIKIEVDNRLLLFEHCHEYYEDYCTKCGMLAHILNGNNLSSIENGARDEIPNDILEIRDSLGQSGIFALKVIPGGVKFGPFNGLDATEGCWRLKGGKLVASEDNSKFLNWMQHVNPARSFSEQNLLVFQYENNLFYRSTRHIQEGEELLVYFGGDHDDVLNTHVEMDFVPPTEEGAKDVFACTFCCLGFDSRDFLAEHKGICHKETDGKFSIEELTQCSFCQIFLGQKEYSEYHLTYCRERNDRKCVPLVADLQTIQTKRGKTGRLQLHKCSQCNYRTKYKSDLKGHVSQHYEVKLYKCGICYNKRFKTKESLKVHMENVHVKVEGDEVQKYSDIESARSKVQFKCSEFGRKRKYYSKKHVQRKHFKAIDYKCVLCEFKATTKHNLNVHIKTKHLKEFSYKCGTCEYKSNRKSTFENHIKTKHLKEFRYECEICKYKTNLKTNLGIHVKTKHLEEFSFQCTLCKYKTNSKAPLQRHIKTKHLKEFNYKCETCDFKTNQKANLDEHVKSKHLKEFNYVCETCAYKTNRKAYLEKHTKTKHLKEFRYRCEGCEYQVNHKSSLEMHIKSKHLKEFDYKCEMCVFKTNSKTDLEKHIKTKHLKEFQYECEACEYKVNHKPSLERHIKVKHLKEFNYKCEICKYETNLKANLQRHRKTKHHKEFNCKLEEAHGLFN